MLSTHSLFCLKLTDVKTRENSKFQILTHFLVLLGSCNEWIVDSYQLLLYM